MWGIIQRKRFSCEIGTRLQRSDSLPNVQRQQIPETTHDSGRHVESRCIRLHRTVAYFEKCGNVYAREEFVQAKDVCQHVSFPRGGLHLLTLSDS